MLAKNVNHTGLTFIELPNRLDRKEEKEHTCNLKANGEST